jgi:hypothetical protein
MANDDTDKLLDELVKGFPEPIGQDSADLAAPPGCARRVGQRPRMMVFSGHAAVVGSCSSYARLRISRPWRGTLHIHRSRYPHLPPMRRSTKHCTSRLSPSPLVWR